MTIIHELAGQGQSIWFDFIQREFIETGELQTLVNQGVRGVTSNPAIFEKAITGSTDYDQALEALVFQGKSVEEIYEALAFDDIKQAADVLRSVYDESNGSDGYVSLEVSPTLAHNTEGTIADAKRLFDALDRPNIMIKIPATPAGIPAIEAAIAAGINVNVTLIFSLNQYKPVVEAYISGLEKLSASGGDVSKVASVASFFVSRVDGVVDDMLESVGNTDLQGKIAIDNAKAAYAYFGEAFSGNRWAALAEKGASVQRPLWASTGVKNPLYLNTLYMDNLIGPNTVNTVPPTTLSAFMDHGTVAATVNANVTESLGRLKQLPSLNIDLDQVTDQLQVDGVAAFANAFESLMSSIAEKRNQLQKDWVSMTTRFDKDIAIKVDEALTQLSAQDIVGRIWAHDHTVWKPEPTEITNRLGWLHIAETMRKDLFKIDALVDAVQSAGFTHALLLGMGGSSLAPEVFRKTFGVKDGFLDLAVLDSTDPGAVLSYAKTLDLAKTLFIVSTKSGGTVETLSFFKYFYNRTLDAVGLENVGEHFVAITDPGSKLEVIAAQHGFRATFLNDPNIGGRYSALSYFGLVPAALVGIDVSLLLDRGLAAASNAQATNFQMEGDNDSAQLGAIFGEMAKHGRDKVTIIASPEIESFGDWAEQLIAESLGKEGKGILPVVGELLSTPDVYGDDRLFVYLQVAGDHTHSQAIDALAEAGQPLICLHLKDLYDLGYQFFVWEMATAISGALLEINAFDQPNVEAAKILARDMVATYETEGKLPVLSPTLKSNNISVYGNIEANTLADALNAFVVQAQDGAYISIQAYIQPSDANDDALLAMRTALRDSTKLATTVGYGPRFLHSTGQLHKGDAGKGLFIQITSDDASDIDIPDQTRESASMMTFGTLKAAQALGDRQALLDNDRQVIRFHIKGNTATGIKRLIS